MEITGAVRGTLNLIIKGTTTKGALRLRPNYDGITLKTDMSIFYLHTNFEYFGSWHITERLTTMAQIKLLKAKKLSIQTTTVVITEYCVVRVNLQRSGIIQIIIYYLVQVSLHLLYYFINVYSMCDV